MQREYDESRDRFHTPTDAGEYTDGLIAIMMRIPDGGGRWISCDRGWYPIIIEVDQKLAELDPNYIVHQIKEKFGGLRYYFEATPNVDEETCRKMDKIVSEAEEMALQTCERCGTKISVGLRKELFHVLSLCDACEGMRREKKTQI